MPNYRRYRVPGGTYFFTITLLYRQSSLLTENIDLLRSAVLKTKSTRPFHINAWVVLPEHMHCVITLPEDDDDYSNRIKAIKIRFVQSIPLIEKRSKSRIARKERGIWLQMFWEHVIRDDRDYSKHLDYIHFNPVKHGLVSRVIDWPYSTFHRKEEEGIYPADWGGVDFDDFQVGEP